MPADRCNFLPRDVESSIRLSFSAILVAAEAAKET
jgi:hypothetical protein